MRLSSAGVCPLTLSFHCLLHVHAMQVLSTQVLDAGITRQLVQRLIRVFPYMCKDRFPLCGSLTATCRIANRRFEYMGRRSQASSTPPGYV